MKLKVEMREEGKEWVQCSCGLIAFRSLQATQEELDVEQGLRQVCSQHGVKIQTFWGSTLYHRDDLPFRPIARWVVLWCHSLLRCPVCSSLQRTVILSHSEVSSPLVHLLIHIKGKGHIHPSVLVGFVLQHAQRRGVCLTIY